MSGSRDVRRRDHVRREHHMRSKPILQCHAHVPRVVYLLWDTDLSGAKHLRRDKHLSGRTNLRGGFGYVRWDRDLYGHNHVFGQRTHLRWIAYLQAIPHLRRSDHLPRCAELPRDDHLPNHQHLLRRSDMPRHSLLRRYDHMPGYGHLQRYVVMPRHNHLRWHGQLRRCQRGYLCPQPDMRRRRTDLLWSGELHGFSNL